MQAANQRSTAPPELDHQAVLLPAPHQGFQRLAWLPIPLFLAALLTLNALPLSGVYNAPHLMLSLNFIFVWLTSVFVAYLAGRSFLANHSLGLLMLGAGVAVWGTAGMVGNAFGSGNPNLTITIHNCCVWFSAICHLAGAAISLRPRPRLRAPGRVLLTAYALAVSAVGLVTVSAVAQWTPVFFIQGQGGTPLRQTVLISAMAMFILTIVLLRLPPRRRTSSFTYWYVLALSLITVGLFGILIQHTFGGALGWTARSAQFLAGIYMLIATIASVRETHVWGISIEEALRESLRESEERLRLAIDAGGLATWDWHIPSGEIIWNDAHFRMLGYEPGTVCSSYEAWANRVHPEDLAATEARHQLSMEQGLDYCDEYRVCWPDGSVHWVESRGRFEQDAAHQARRSYGVMHEITERKHLETILQQAKQDLETRVKERTAELEHAIGVLQEEVFEHTRTEEQLIEANATLVQRTAQLRTLASELTMTEQRERRRLTEILHDHLQQLLVAAKFQNSPLLRLKDEMVQKASRKVDDLLTQSIDTSRTLTAELCPPILYDGTFKQSLEWLGRWMQSKYNFQVELAYDTPATAGLSSADAAASAGNESMMPEVEAEAEAPLALPEEIKVLLFQAVRELLFNVVKHAGVETAQVSVKQSVGQLQVIVQDQGAGFAPSAWPPVDEQLPGGYGLFVIQERLDLLGGQLDIESTPGQGSRFTITAPLAITVKGQSKQPTLSRDALQTFETDTVARLDLDELKIRLMLVDDHSVMRQGLAQLLAHEPDIQIVGEAGDGFEAVELARQLQPDVILMDINMPGMNGIEATRVIHGEWPAIKVIGLSMFEEAELAAEMRRAGAIEYFPKSGAIENVIIAIRAARQRNGQ